MPHPSGNRGQYNETNRSFVEGPYNRERSKLAILAWIPPYLTEALLPSPVNPGDSHSEVL
jgi:hypothetical protein